MAWSQRQIETELRRKLQVQFQHAPDEVEKFMSYYSKAKDTLLNDNIFNSIALIQRDLSDHSENHIMNVLDNVYKLLVHKKYDAEQLLISEHVDQVESIQLYFICMLVLFHDVGNLTTDREKHHEQDVIREVYDYVRKGETGFNDERIMVPEVASKHSGTASDGTQDTIAELGLHPPHLFGVKIPTKKCAALLRFADELAEGPHRTSIFMNAHYNYPYKSNSVIYHKYAKITKIDIDRENERICVNYTFTIQAKNGKIKKSDNLEFVKLFEFTIKRMLKLDAERKYCKYHCDWLSPFRRTHATFNYFLEDIKTRKSRRIVPSVGNLNEIFIDDLTLPNVSNEQNFLRAHGEFNPLKAFNLLRGEFNEK